MWNILISDDETIERMIIKKVLTDYYKENCHIYEATDGIEALDITKKVSLQIAIMDIFMPELNGIEASKKILQLQPCCRIIFLTAYDDFDYIKVALNIRAVDYLLKPCPDEELINAVDLGMMMYKSLTLLRQAENMFSAPSDSLTNESAVQRSSAKAAQIISYIRENYNQELSLYQISEKFGYSEVYFCKFFKQHFNINFSTYLTLLRMEKAKELLSDPAINIKSVGRQVGYTDSNYFSKVFKRITGKSPSEYHHSIREQLSNKQEGEFLD